MNFLKNVLKPISLDILSINRVSDLRTRIQFLVTFEIQLFLFGKRFQFETIGVLETSESVEQSELSDIISQTDYTKYLDLNLKNKEVGNFDYKYLYRDNLFTINYKTF